MHTFRNIISFFIITTLILLLPKDSLACACGCNVFTVGGRWMMPISPGFGFYWTYNYMDQYYNWNGWNRAASGLNEDKVIRSEFYNLNVIYTASRNWSIMVEAPVWNRFFNTTADDGTPASVNHLAFADVRLTGLYTGISEDMSTGIQFGLKLPTGPYNLSLLDRDTQIGTGTTDLLLGGYKMTQENGWGWYAQAMWQHALNYKDGYRPGDSFDISFGARYDNLLQSYKIEPMLQLVVSFRSSDSGVNSDPVNTGYARLYISPGIEVKLSEKIQLYGNLKIPIVTHVSGYQLVAPALVDVTFGYQF